MARDVFSLDEGLHAAWLAAARYAARELDLGGRLGEALPARWRALAEVLTLEGDLVRTDGGWALAASVPAELASTHSSELGGQLVTALRDDRARSTPAEHPGYQRHLASVGRPAAEALWQKVARVEEGYETLLDLGGGLGTYAAAWAAGGSARRATVVDRAAVLSLAEATPRLRPLAADLLSDDWGGDFDCALLCNVLHLYDEPTARALLRRAAGAVRPGGVVVVKDLYVDADRLGPAAGLWFSLNMALYTDGGVAHDVEVLRRGLGEAGVATVESLRLPEAPDSVVLWGRR